MKAGDRVVCSLPQKNDETAAFDFNLDILFEDHEVLVLNKPPSLTVHPGANTGDRTLLNALIYYYKKSAGNLPPVFQSVSKFRGGIVHRLDKDTSGLLVIAKTLPALQTLAKQFADRTVKRTYHALVYSTPRGKRIISQNDSGIVNLPIGRDPKRRVAMGVGGVKERQAQTEWKVVERYPYATLLRLRLRTGRTHQIRVHLNAIGSPVIGDKTYGDFSGLPQDLLRAANHFGRQALHAKTLGFVHPANSKFMEFDSELPADMQKLIKKFSKKNELAILSNKPSQDWNNRSSY